MILAFVKAILSNTHLFLLGVGEIYSNISNQVVESSKFSSRVLNVARGRMDSVHISTSNCYLYKLHLLVSLFHKQNQSCHCLTPV